jgi:type IX secretion system PorP/SprF family membrane protein
MRLFIKIVFISVIAVLAALSCIAQQDAQFTQYMYNNLYISPAVAGITGQPEVGLIARSQWLNYQSTGSNSSNPVSGGQPNSQLLSASMPVRKLHGGVGLVLVNDKVGPTKNTQIGITYSYHLSIGAGKLGIGLKMGLANASVNGSEYKAQNPNDINIPDGNVSQSKSNFDLGLWYHHEKYYLGGSLTHINSPDFNSVGYSLTPHFYLTGGYHFEVGRNVKFTPTLLLKSPLNQKGTTLDLNGIFTLHEKYWIGALYRYGDAVGLLAGINLLKDNSLKVGYALDFTVVGTDAKQSTSHEVMLALVLPPIVNLPKPIIRTPRYRFD